MGLHGTIAKRVETLEKTVEALESLPSRMDAFEERLDSVEGQIVQLRAEMRAEFSALRTEMKAGNDALRTELRAEIREGDEETRTLMRVLHEACSLPDSTANPRRQFASVATRRLLSRRRSAVTSVKSCTSAVATRNLSAGSS